MEMSECIHIYDNCGSLETEESQRGMEQRALNTNGDRKERMVDIYDSADNCGAHDFSSNTEEAELQNTADQRPGNIIHPVKTQSWTITVCLLLLCILLLGGITGLVVHYNLIEGSLEGRLSMCNFTSTADRDKLQSLNKKREETLAQINHFCGAGCIAFNNSFYYISVEYKTWEESRQDCLDKGADLVIINSEEEQKFISSFKKIYWIGLSDRNERGTWRWVDGSLLNSTQFWGTGRPSDTSRGEKGKCVNIYWYQRLYSWYDEDCTSQRSWVCEKRIDF